MPPATSISRSQRTLWLRLLMTITGVYVLPVVVLASGVVDPKWRFHVLIAMSAIAVAIAIARDHSFTVPARTLPRVSELVTWSILPSALLVAGMFATNFGTRFTPVARLPFYAFFVFVSAPAQEFLYRSFLFEELTAAKVRSSYIILVSALLFAFMHIIYRDAVTLALTFAAGLLWGVAFHRTRSFCVVALSHAILGAGAIARGVI